MLTKTFAAALIVLAMMGCNSTGDRVNRSSLSDAEALKMNVSLPAGVDVSGRNSWHCRSLLETDLTGSYDASLTKGLEGKVAAGGNSASVSLEGSKHLLLLSGAAFSAGTTNGSQFDIVANTQNHLAATFFDGTSVNTLVLNKRNGLAIWSKVRSTFPVYNAPTGAQSYMTCQ